VYEVRKGEPEVKNTERTAFEEYLKTNIPAAITENSFACNEDGSYQNPIVRGHYHLWEAARADFQARLEARADYKDLNRAVKFAEGCDCGCNSAAFTRPFDALRFLMHRMNGAGVGDAVGVSYAHDIMQILKEHDAVESDDHLSIVRKEAQ
jgi:hypothetical protein